MFDLTSRQVNELVWLCSQDEPVLVGDMAYRFHISPRTVRNDLVQVEQFVGAYHLWIERRHGKGILLAGAAEDKGEMLDVLSWGGRRVFGHAERCSIMAMVLLLRDSATFQQLADACGVSRQTAIRDLHDVEASLAKEGISVERCQGKGLTLVADERSTRHAFVQLLANNPCPDIVVDCIGEDAGMQECESQAQALVDSCKRALGFTFQDERYIWTLVCFVLKRMRTGHFIGDDSPLGRLGVSINHVDALERAIAPLVMRASERNYLATLILSQRIGPHPSETERTAADAMSSEAERISEYLVNALSEYQCVDDVDTHGVVTMLTEHIRAALYRQQDDIQLRDDTLESYVQLTSPLIYEFTRQTLNECGVAFAAGEVAYIAMYIASIFESSGGKELVPSVLFVCSFGLATSALLKSRLERLLFGCRLIGSMAPSKATEYLSGHEVDLVVTTCDFSTTLAPVLRVDPMLTQNDIDRVKGYVNQLPYTKMSSRFVERYSERWRGRSFHQVSDFVSADAIQVVNACETWDAAIRIAASPLVKRDLMESRYVETMIHAVRELGTYMVLTPGTAYVHAGVDDGILSDCVAVLVSRTPIRFGTDKAKSVRTIVVLGIRHRDRSSLLHLASIFGAPDNLRLVRAPGLDVRMVESMHD